MKRYWWGIILVLIAGFCIHVGFAEMEALTDGEMGEVTAQTGVLGKVVGFSQAYAASSGGQADLERAVPFNLAYVQQIRDMEDNVRNFDEIFQRMETRPLEDGWTYFEFEYNSPEEIRHPGEQLSYNDVWDKPVESGLGLLGMGGFRVERSGQTHIRASGKIKIEFRP